MDNFITAIYTVPTINNAPNAFSTIEKVANQLGLLHCDLWDDAAAVAYKGIISKENKQKLQNIAKNDSYVLIFVEAEENTKFIDWETIHIPTNDEMKEHLAWE